MIEGKMYLIIIGLVTALASIPLTRSISGILGAITLIVGLYLMNKAVIR